MRGTQGAEQNGRLVRWPSISSRRRRRQACPSIRGRGIPSPRPPAFTSSHSRALPAILMGTDWKPARLKRRRHWSARSHPATLRISAPKWNCSTRARQGRVVVQRLHEPAQEEGPVVARVLLHQHERSRGHSLRIVCSTEFSVPRLSFTTQCSSRTLFTGTASSARTPTSSTALNSSRIPSASA
jgi:hypothetical protein